MKKQAIVLIMLAVLCASPCICQCAGLEIDGDKFSLDGKPFFIKAAGYAPWRPGQWPGSSKVDNGIVEHDFRLIRSAGFNAIRTWEALDREQLALALTHGLFVIQGIWIDPEHDFSDSQWQELQLRRIREVATYSKDFPNVLFYLVMTEPTTKAVTYAGEEQTEEFFKKIVSAIKEVDNRPVSMDSWIPAGFLDHSMWDIVTFNVFMFSPESINKVLGFEEYVRLIKERYAPNKPLFIGETGGFSVSKKRIGTLGFGGNTEKEQAKGDVDSIKACVKAGAAGVATVSWIDTWHYPSEPGIHNDEPWEWDGIIALEDKDDPFGRPRKVFYELKKLNKKLGAGRQSRPKGQTKLQLSIDPVKDVFKAGEDIEAAIKLKSGGKPVAGRKVKYGFFSQEGWKESTGEASTDASGMVKASCGFATGGETGYVLVFASAQEGGQKVSDIIFVKVPGQ